MTFDMFVDVDVVSLFLGTVVVEYSGERAGDLVNFLMVLAALINVDVSNAHCIILDRTIHVSSLVFDYFLAQSIMIESQY